MVPVVELVLLLVAHMRWRGCTVLDYVLAYMAHDWRDRNSNQLIPSVVWNPNYCFQHHTSFVRSLGGASVQAA